MGKMVRMVEIDVHRLDKGSSDQKQVLLRDDGDKG